MAKVTLTSKSSAMKSYLPFLTFAVILASCSSVYKSGQTPDDVYFSPERPQEEYVRVEKRDDSRRYGNDELDREDRYLRMKVTNRRYGLLDDYDYYAYNGNNYYRYSDYYRFNNYQFNYHNYNRYWGMMNNGYYNWNHGPIYYNPYYASPYYSGVVYGNTNPKYNKPRTSNLHVFDRNGNPNNPNVPKNNGRIFSSSGNGNNDNYRGSGSNAGGFMRDVFGGNNNNSSSSGKTTVGNSNNNNNSSSSSSNSGSSSSSSSSGSSRAPVRKF